MNEENNNNYDNNVFYGPRGLAIKILNRIDRTDAYLDKLIDVELKRNELNGKDKALLFELVHGVIRWMLRLDWVLTGFFKGQYAKSIPDIKNGLRVAVYQILFLDKIPDYAAVDQTVEYIKKLQGQKAANQANAVLRSIIRSKDNISYPSEENNPVYYLSNYYSHPLWMIKRWTKRFGFEFTEELVKANNRRPKITIRVNNLKSNKTELKQLLESVNLVFSEGKYLPDYFVLESQSNITDWEYFKKGFFTIQDESTGLPCSLLDVKSTDRILDMCAAPGGKTALLAEISKNQAEITALDKYESRLKVLEKNLTRLGIENVKMVIVDALEFEDAQGFDKILIDAPCSGLGTLAKKPDIKWKREFMHVKQLNPLQLDLLRKASKLVKVDGNIVYSTCTIEPEENWEIIQQFLDENLDFEIVDAKSIFTEELVNEIGFVETFPNKHGIDGSFAVKLRRKK